MKSVVITGVSTGIGRETAAELCRLGYRVFGSVRSDEHAESLRRALGPVFTPLRFDVTDPGAIAAAVEQVRDDIAGAPLFGLVNNAGISRPGPLSEISPDLLREHLEVNVVGPLRVVQAFLPMLRSPKGSATRPGRIVNISSVSGRIAYPFMGPYAASKHALEALSDSLRRELMVYGVDVVVIQPGAVDTPIWNKAAYISTAFHATDYGPALEGIDLLDERRRALPVAAVVRKIIKALTHRRPRARYVVPDRWIRLWLAPRWLPDRVLDRIIARMLKLKEIRAGLP